MVELSEARGPCAASTVATIVYDGDCGFCTWSATLLRRLVPALPRLVDGTNGDLSGLELDRDDTQRSAWLIVRDRDGLHHFSGADVLGEVLRRQPTPAHRVVGHLLGVPVVAAVAQEAYHLIARNRHRLPGGTTSCELPRAA